MDGVHSVFLVVSSFKVYLAGNVFIVLSKLNMMGAMFNQIRDLFLMSALLH